MGGGAWGAHEGPEARMGTQGPCTSTESYRDESVYGRGGEGRRGTRRGVAERCLRWLKRHPWEGASAGKHATQDVSTVGRCTRSTAGGPGAKRAGGGVGGKSRVCVRAVHVCVRGGWGGEVRVPRPPRVPHTYDTGQRCQLCRCRLTNKKWGDSWACTRPSPGRRIGSTAAAGWRRAAPARTHTHTQASELGYPGKEASLSQHGAPPLANRWPRRTLPHAMLHTPHASDAPTRTQTRSLQARQPTRGAKQGVSLHYDALR